MLLLITEATAFTVQDRGAVAHREAVDPAVVASHYSRVVVLWRPGSYCCCCRWLASCCCVGGDGVDGCCCGGSERFSLPRGAVGICLNG